MMRMLTIEETAELLGVHPNTVRSMLPRLGAIDLNRGTKGKRLIRIPEDSLARFVQDCVIQAMQPVRQVRPTVMKIERRRA